TSAENHSIQLATGHTGHLDRLSVDLCVACRRRRRCPCVAQKRSARLRRDYQSAQSYVRVGRAASCSIRALARPNPARRDGLLLLFSYSCVEHHPSSTLKHALSLRRSSPDTRRGVVSSWLALGSPSERLGR